MSLWISFRDKDGRRKAMSVGAHPTIIISLLGIGVALLLPLFQWLRELMR